jgi:hypothetical protein
MVVGTPGLLKAKNRNRPTLQFVCVTGHRNYDCTDCERDEIEASQEVTWRNEEALRVEISLLMFRS